MAKHTILFGCGHIAAAEVNGTEFEQVQTLQYLKICGRCPACEAAHKNGQTAEKEA